MADPTPLSRHEHPDDGFELLLRQRLGQLADHAPTTVHSLDEIRVLHHSWPRRRDRRHRRAAGIGATIAALAGAIGFTTIALSGAGSAGAASPEDAVREFITATADEDILGMIDLIDPVEAPAVRTAIDEGRAEAVGANLIDEGFSLDGLDGLDLSFSDLDLVTESLGDGLAVVTAAAGSASWTFDPALFPLGQQLQEAFAGDLVLTTRTARLDELVSPSMLATVERDGRWFVSVSFTLAEYARQAADLALPATTLTAVGADTPEAAADEFFANLIALDLPGAFATAAPGEGDALLRYGPLLFSESADAIADYRASGFDLQLSGSGYSVAGEGARRTLSAETFTISGTVPEPAVYGFYDPMLPTVVFSYDGSSVSVIEAGVPFPATTEGLEFDTAFDFPEGEWNQTSVDAAGNVMPLPALPASDGPDDITIRRSDGCTTWSGVGAQALFGPGRMVVGSGGSVSSTEIPPSGDVDVSGSTAVEVDASTDQAGDDVAVGQAAEVPGFEQLDDRTWRSCTPDVGAFGLLTLVGTAGLTALPSIEVVEIDGLWYVSPIGTLADVVLDLISSVRASGSLLDSQVAWFVLGTDGASLEAMLVGAPVDQLTVECQALVESDATTVTGLRQGDLDLGTVRACVAGPVYQDGYSSFDDSTTFLPAAPAIAPDTAAGGAPASTNPP